MTCNDMLEHARWVFDSTPRHGYLKALLLDDLEDQPPLEGEKTVREVFGPHLATLCDGVPRRSTAVVVPVDFRSGF